MRPLSVPAPGRSTLSPPASAPRREPPSPGIPVAGAWSVGCPRGERSSHWGEGVAPLPTSHPNPLPLPRPTSTHDRPARESWVVWCGVGRMRVPPGPGCLGGLSVVLVSVFFHPCFAGESQSHPGRVRRGAPPGGGGVHPAGVRHHGRDGPTTMRQATRAAQAGGNPRPNAQTQLRSQHPRPSRRRGRDSGGPEVGWLGRWD